MATINKTPCGTWKAVIRRVGWPTTAKTFRTRRDAEDWSRQTEDEMIRGVYINRSNAERLTVEAALDRYMREVAPTKKQSTQDREVFRVRELVKFFGKYSLAAVTPDLVARFRDKRLGEGKADSTVRLELALLSHLFTTALKEWRIGLIQNPVSNIRWPSPAKGRDRRLREGEQAKLLEAAARHSNPFFQQIVTLGIETGMRRGEILGLRRGDVNLAKRIVILRDTKNGNTRTVPLTKAATQALSAALAHPIRPINCDLIFFGEPGKDGVRRGYAFERVWEQTKKEIGANDLHFHDLRHEAVSRMVEAGMSDQEVSTVSGHKSMQMLRRYTHLRAEDLIEKLDVAMGRRQ
ncbi:MAG: site-specific integrase [Proteobacteria bacterium]|nr:site-specific integrase [Pseudomonadota bacterium]